MLTAHRLDPTAQDTHTVNTPGWDARSLSAAVAGILFRPMGTRKLACAAGLATDGERAEAKTVGVRRV